MKHKLLAPLLFIVVYALGSVVFIPGLPFNLAAGVFFGPFLGSLVALTGSAGGATISFLIARYGLRFSLSDKGNIRLLKNMQERIANKGWRFVALVRLGFIGLPSGPINLLFGFTPISTWSYIWSSFVFLYPPTLAFSIVGYSISSFALNASQTTTSEIILLIISLIFICIFSGWSFITVQRKRQRRKKLSHPNKQDTL